jgi:hypothetical protein
MRGFARRLAKINLLAILSIDATEGSALGGTHAP